MNQLLLYVTYVSIERYSNVVLLAELVNGTVVHNCVTDEKPPIQSTTELCR